MTGLPSGKGRWLVIAILVLLSPLLLYLGLIVLYVVIFLISLFMNVQPVLFIIMIIMLVFLYLKARGKSASTYRGIESGDEKSDTWLECNRRKHIRRDHSLTAIAIGVLTFVLVVPVSATLLLYVFTLFISVYSWLVSQFSLFSEYTIDSPFEGVMSLSDVYLQSFSFILSSLICGLIFSIYVILLHINGKLAVHKHFPFLPRSYIFDLVVISISVAMILSGAAFSYGFAIFLIPGVVLSSRLGYSLMRIILLEHKCLKNSCPSNEGER